MLKPPLIRRSVQDFFFLISMDFSRKHKNLCQKCTRILGVKCPSEMTSEYCSHGLKFCGLILGKKYRMTSNVNSQPDHSLKFRTGCGHSEVCIATLVFFHSKQWLNQSIKISALLNIEAFWNQLIEFECCHDPLIA